MIGVYTITNKLDGKMYVGSSKDIDSRIRRHKSDLKNNKHHNAKLQNAVNKYKLNNFNFELLVECELEHQFAIECYWYNLLNPSYNLIPINPNGGSGVWSIQRREDSVKYSDNRIRVICTPIESEDDRECYLFESQNQAARVMFPDINKIRATKGIRDVVTGKEVQYKGWHFKRLCND